MARRILVSLALAGLALGLASGCGSGAPSASEYGTLSVTPSGDPLVLTAGESADFAVALIRNEDLPLDVEVPALEPVWSVTGDIGAVDASTGAFAAAQTASSASPTEGSVNVTTSLGSVSVPVRVTVTADAVSRIVLSAPAGTNLDDLRPGQQVQFTAIGEDPFGNRSAGARVVLSPTWACDAALGAIDQNGLFTARTGTAVSAVTGSVTATAPGVGGTVSGAEDVTVQFPAALSVGVTSLDFSDQSTTLPIPIANLGSLPLTWQLSESIAWLSLDAASGSEEGTVQATVSRSGLAVGTYTGTITVTGSDGATASIAVSMAVTTIDVIINGTGASR